MVHSSQKITYIFFDIELIFRENYISVTWKQVSGKKSWKLHYTYSFVILKITWKKASWNYFLGSRIAVTIAAKMITSPHFCFGQEVRNKLKLRYAIFYWAYWALLLIKKNYVTQSNFFEFNNK